MKFMLFTATAMTLMTASLSYAQGTEDNYDFKNTRNLEAQTGFTALNLDRPIVQDAVEEQPTPQQLNRIESAAGQAVETPTAPSEPTVSMTQQGTEPSAPMTKSVIYLDEIQPSTGEEATTMQTTPNEVIMREEGEAQTVIRTQTIIGNTDTGVDPEKVIKALEDRKN